MLVFAGVAIKCHDIRNRGVVRNPTYAPLEEIPCSPKSRCSSLMERVRSPFPWRAAWRRRRVSMFMPWRARWTVRCVSRARADRYGRWNRGNLSPWTRSRAVAVTGASVLLPIDLPGIRFAAQHREGLDRIAALSPVPDPDTLEIAENKWSLAGFLAEQGLNHPPTLLVAADASFARAVAEFPFPVLLKPTTGGYGQGIHAFADRESLLRHLASRSSDQQLIVQAFLPGEDIDCSVLCERGKIVAHTIQKGFLPAPQPFRPCGGITFLDDNRVLDVARELMNRLKWHGVAHIDMRYDSRGGGPSIIEINPRFWGSLLGSLAAGVNFPRLACCAALGVPFAAPQTKPGRFVAGGTAFRHWVRPPWRRGSAISFRETSFRYALTDPGPEVFEALSAFWRKIRRKLRWSA
jgi:hypothetical protein